MEPTDRSSYKTRHKMFESLLQENDEGLDEVTFEWGDIPHEESSLWSSILFHKWKRPAIFGKSQLKFLSE